MAPNRDPLEYAADEDRDLHGIATWEPRSVLDRVLVTLFPDDLYTWLVGDPRSMLDDRIAGYLSIAVRVVVFLVALLIFAGVLLLLGVQVLLNPGSVIFLVLFPLSVIPALLLAGYVWYTDITSEPILTLIATYLLAIVLASFPYLINTLTGVLMTLTASLLPPGIASNAFLAFLAQSGQFYLVVAPVEEVAKLAAVVIFVYWRADFDTVIDGAVYGAIAGLGFATIENTSYIIQVTAGSEGLLGLLVTGAVITTVRSIAGPGHVIWTAIAGYYLGLAKFSREHTLALVVKGLLIATILHGTYNTVSTGISVGSGALGLGLLGLVASFGFIFVFHTGAFTYLFLKLRRYRKAYATASPGDHAAEVSEIDGYDESDGTATAQAAADADRGAAADPADAEPTGTEPTSADSTGAGPTVDDAASQDSAEDDATTGDDAGGDRDDDEGDTDPGGRDDEEGG